jgi:hypothetical protein
VLQADRDNVIIIDDLEMLPDGVKPHRRRKRRRRRGGPGELFGKLFATASLITVATASAAMLGRLDVSFAKQDLARFVAEAAGPGAKVDIGSASLFWGAEGLSIEVTGLRLASSDFAGEVAVPRAEVAVDPVALLEGRIVPRHVALNGLSMRAAMAPSHASLPLAGGHDVMTVGSIAPLVVTDKTPPGWLRLFEDAALPDITLTDFDLELKQANGKTQRLENLAIRRSTADDGVVVEVATAPQAAQGRFAAIRLREHDIKSGTVRLAFQIPGWLPADLTALTDERLPFAGAATVTGDGELTLADGETLTQVTATVAVSGGMVANHVPLLGGASIDRIGFFLRAKPQDGELVFKALDAKTSSLALSGDVAFSKLSNAHDIAIKGSNLGMRPLEPALARYLPLLTDAKLEAKRVAGEWQLHELATQSPFGSMTVTGRFGEAMNTPAALQFAFGELALQQLPKSLPFGLADLIPDRAIKAVESGTASALRVNAEMSAAQRLSLAKGVFPASGITWSAEVKDLRLAALGDLPPLRFRSIGLSGTMANLAASAPTFSVPLADGATLSLTDAELALDGFASKSGFNFSAKLDSDLKTLKLLASDKRISEQLPDALKKADFSGRFAGAIRVLGKLDGSGLKPAIDGKLKGLDLVFGEGLRLEDANLDLSIKNGETRIDGKGSYQGLPLSIDFALPETSARPALKAALVIDEAARRKQGIDLGNALKGPVTVSVAARMPLDAADRRSFEVDLTKAAIRDLVPGWVKASGKPAKASFRLDDRGKGYRVKDLQLDGGSLRASGEIDLDAKGNWQSARLSRLRFPTGESGSATITRPEGVLTADIKANTLDARPWLARAGGLGGPGSAAPVALSIAATALQGHNDEIISGAEFSTRAKGGSIKGGALSGRLNGKPIRLRIRDTAEETLLNIRSEDAGATLRFLDAYRRMLGGRVWGTVKIDGARQSGTITFRDFTLVDEPALRRVVAATGVIGSGKGAVTESRVKFQKARVQFERDNGRVIIREGVMWGDSVGGSITGWIDYDQDRVNLAGTFVPAYALNNFLANIPVLGPVLTGGKYEGIFAVPFTISGKASRPRLTINALSAAAPGIFRKLLDLQNQPDLPPDASQD